MGKRELIYKDEARRAVLTQAPGIAWCIDSIKPVGVIDSDTQKPAVQTDDYWIARINYWGEKPKIDVVIIYYVWNNGEIDFIPFQSADGDPIRTTCCEQFELLEKVEVEKYQ